MFTRKLLLVTILMSGTSLSSPLWAQTEDTTPADPVAEEVETMEETPMEQPTADTGEETTAEPMEADPSALEDLIAADPNLTLVEGEDGEADEMEMLADVLFSFGSAQLNDAALESLSSVAAIIDEYPSVTIVGHTDSIGSESANEALGLLRAEAVRNYLIENSDMTVETITVESAGETDPKTPNLNEDGSDNPEGRALNRRVVFVFEGM